MTQFIVYTNYLVKLIYYQIIYESIIVVNSNNYGYIYIVSS
jgi:hypothetical protein